MAVKNTGATALKFVKPDNIVITLYNGATGETDNDPKGDTYILEDVVRDTTSVTQDDNDSTDIDRETNDTPIMSIVTLGRYQLAAEVADTQADLLVDICNFVKDEKDNKVYAPQGYVVKYAKFAIVSGDSAVILPKVQLNSRVTMESLNTNIGRIALAGTAQLASITINVDKKAGSDGGPDTFTSKVIKTPYYIDPAYELPK
mgnify:CR=1 FL=1